MKSASLPPVRVTPGLRLDVESVLAPGETMSQFVEAAVQAAAQRRKQQADFVQRGLASIRQTQADGGGIAADEVIARLEAKLAAARRVRIRRD